MRTVRPLLAGMVILSLAGGLPAAVVAQPDDEAVLPPTEFSGTLPCPDDEYQEGTIETVILGRSEDGSVVRREVRGSTQPSLSA